MLKFPSIDSFRHAVATVKRAYEYKQLPLPKIMYTGTVKLHGTNAGIHVDLNTKALIPQSRERELTVDSDNAGFARWVEDNRVDLLRYFNEAFGDLVREGAGFTVFGEWIGPGIQKNVAINGLSAKKFVIMSVAFDDEIEDTEDGQRLCVFYNGLTHAKLGIALPENVHLISEIQPVQLLIDFAQPDLVVAELERLTNEYETQCPFAAQFGLEGIGEGLVWSPLCLDFEEVIPLNMQQRMWFKTKGEKHGNKGTNNTVKVAVTAEKVEDFNALLAQIMPEWRLEQGMTKLREGGVAEPSKAHTGDFIKWVVGDVHKEELDTVEASEFEWKVVAGELSKRARTWFFTKV